MDPLASLLGIAALLAVTIAVGLLLRRRHGRVRDLSAATASTTLDPGIFGLECFGERGTIVQFSTEYCARCPGVRRHLTELVATRDGVEFTHVDLTHNVDLARQFHVLQTPTLLFISADGRPLKRLSGQFSHGAIRDAVDGLTAGALSTPTPQPSNDLEGGDTFHTKTGARA